MMIDGVNISADRDEPDVVQIEHEGMVVNLKRGGAHGYWSIHYPKGRLPKQLQGQYTNKSLAEQAAIIYLKNHRSVKS